MNQYLIILNLIFLIPLAVMDYKTHTVPVVVTALFVLMSLYVTTIPNILAAIIVVVAMYVFCKATNMGTGDRKIIFGLTLQYGYWMCVSLFAFIIVVLFAHGLIKKHQSVPLLPVILASYIIYIPLLYVFL